MKTAQSVRFTTTIGGNIPCSNAKDQKKHTEPYIDNGGLGSRIGAPSKAAERMATEDSRSHLALNLNKRQQSRQHSSPIAVSRYRQTWKLVTFAPKFKSTALGTHTDKPVEAATRIIRVQMELDYTFPDEDDDADSGKLQYYKRAFKSIASDFMQVQNIHVTESNNEIDTTTSSSDVVTLRHNLEDREGHQFLSFDFHNPISPSSSTSVVITYDLINAIEGCRGTDGACMEYFAAPWANQWDVPVIVNDIKYQFEIETEGMLVNSNHTSGANSTTTIKDDWVRYDGMKLSCDTSESCNSNNCEVTTSDSSSVIISCPVLDTTRNSSPEQPEFQWSLNFDNNLNNSTALNLGPHCSTECHANYSTTSFSVYLGNMTIALLILMAVITKVLKGQRLRIQEVRDNTAAEAARREKEHQRMKKEEEIKTLPIVAYGADNEKVKSAIRTYYDILKMRKGGGGLEATIAHDEEDFYHQQLVACTACTSCSICITDFEESEEALLLPDCGHVFHYTCIGEWLVARCRDTCPLCQKEVGLG